MHLQILEGTPKGLRILHFPGREQAWTIQQYKGLKNDQHTSLNWRTREFCKSEREAWARLKVMAG